ncbi:MAG: type IV secretion system DNA-binding domain-containing protein [Clostridia bacterium]|nr:type IV secretion system DNA-binding domain-containing protein [Clostridia bacterium]
MAITPFDIAEKYPIVWKNIKYAYIIVAFIAYTIIFKSTIFKFLSKFQTQKNIKQNNISEEKFKLKIGTNKNGELVNIEEQGLYQNIIVTGTIGSGKTSSAMYPFTKQIMSYKSNNFNEKIAMLILDVKGNYYKKVEEFAKELNREEDVIKIDLTSRIKYNPLDKPNLKPIVLANRLKTILLLFNQNNSESYWLDKAEQVLTECIKFCRMYNDEYVDFSELHKLVMFEDYYKSKVEVVREKFLKGELSTSNEYELLSCMNFFQKEFFSLDSRTLSILKSEISRITNIFVSDYNVSKTFCPPKNEINFEGFDEVLDKGKIVVLNMNISEYKNLSKIIAAYLKLDFQTTVMNRLSNNKRLRKSCFISDEYHEYVTNTDSDFFAQSREAKCINIVATQSYTSLLNTIKDESTVKVIIQSLVNKIWFRTDDMFTIEEAQKLVGKEEKQKSSVTISENAKETNYNFFVDAFVSRDSSISESYNKFTQTDYIYDTNFFTQELKTFSSLCFLSTGFKILKPQELDMIPYFKDEKRENNNYLKGFEVK